MRPFTNKHSHMHLIAVVAMSLLLVRCQSSHLRVGFYRGSCESAESIVKDEVRKAFIRDKGLAAGLLRMHFHDCFVRGCDASVTIDSTPTNKAEKDAPPNNPSLRGFEVIDSAKARLEAVCKGVVSCADIIAFAARESVEISGGTGYDVPAGRRDGRISRATEAVQDLPPPTFSVTQLTRAFARRGFTQKEMVTLSGGHTIGRSHCTAFNQRLYNFSGIPGQDPTLDPAYAETLKKQCPKGSSNPNLVVPMDPGSDSKFDSDYYANILRNRGLFTSDATLLSDSNTRSQVVQNAQNSLAWKLKFANAMIKMGKLNVLTGSDGEIRANCRVVNS